MNFSTLNLSKTTPTLNQAKNLWVLVPFTQYIFFFHTFTTVIYEAILLDRRRYYLSIFCSITEVF